MIVFGRLGFNQINMFWRPFAEQHPELRISHNPFRECPRQPIACDGHVLWFVAEEDNHGMTDDQVTAALDEALEWAKANRIKSIATNGIMNSERHGHDARINRQIDDQRAAYLIAYAARVEEALGIRFELISLCDIFVRNTALVEEEGC